VTEVMHAPAQMQGSVMPQAYFFAGPSLTSIERPRCTSRMMLARISPGPMGFEHRRFECPKCNSCTERGHGERPYEINFRRLA
jgi:hypothetical protein